MKNCTSKLSEGSSFPNSKIWLMIKMAAINFFLKCDLYRLFNCQIHTPDLVKGVKIPQKFINDFHSKSVQKEILILLLQS